MCSEIVSQTIDVKQESILPLTSKGSNTRSNVLHESLFLFAENGYSGTSLEQVANKLGIKKPTLFHHVKNKEQLAVNVILVLLRYFEKKYFVYSDKTKPFFNEPVSMLGALLVDKNKKCFSLLCAMSVGLEERSSEFKGAIHKYATNWVNGLVSVLGKSMGVKEAKPLAKSAFVKLHGAWLIDNLIGDSDSSLRIIEELKKEWSAINAGEEITRI